jgi:hypothetical protein
MKILLSALIFFFALFIVSSCGNGAADKDKDSILETDSIPPDLDSTLNADSVVTASYHMSKEDSTRIADSIARKKNPIRDFN